MIAYLDSSVLLRTLLNQEGRFQGFSEIEKAIASKLLKSECLRALDRSRLGQLLAETEYLAALDQLYEALDSVELIEISDGVLDRAGSSFSTAIGTLDAIHLASALVWRERSLTTPMFLTHDLVLGTAARAHNFEVVGL